MTIDETVTAEACEHGGEDPTSTLSCGHEKRVQIDIVIETTPGLTSRPRSSTVPGTVPGTRAASPRP